MAGSTRFELASGSPEGSAFNATYTNGQRANYGGPTLDRSGSFREGIDNRMLTSGPSTSRGGPTSMEMPPLTQYLTLEMFTLAEPKFTRSVELRRILGASLGVTSEDHPFGSALVKPLSPLVTEELKRFRMSLLETSIKAKDRLKTINDSTVKLDKYRHTLFSRKRQRNEIATERSGGANLLKMGNQISQPPPDLATQRLEDRTKSGVPNKRVRTSMVEVRSEGRSTNVSRQGVLIDKERDTSRAGNGGPIQVEDKIRGLPAGGDGWDKKMKRKRSVGLVVTRAVDGDRDPKRGMGQRLNNEARPRSTEGHGFRSGSSSGVIGTNKLDGTSQPSSSSTRATPRNELDNVSHPSERRGAAGIDKEKVVMKGNSKLNLREDGQVGSPGAVTKGKASRALRTGSNVLLNSSSNFTRASGTLDGWEQAPCPSKGQPVGGINNRKRSIPTGSSSPPVAQWVGQRPQKISRTRRTNLVSPVSNNDESHIPSEGLATPDMGARLPPNETSGGPVLGRGMPSSSQPFKLKLENVASPAGLSESEESGAGDSKIKEKGIDNGEIEDRNVNAIHKVGTFVLPTKKSKILVKEDIGDGVRRQGRSGRAATQSRVCMPLAKEKVENAATTKPMRGSRPGSDRGESKSGRPPTKKLSDRKAFPRPGHVVNSSLSEFTGESDDDHEELLAAANFARSAGYHACSSAFWKKMEPIFALVNSEDIAYLRQQISFVEELDESLRPVPSGNLLCGTVPSESPQFGEGQGSQSNGTVPHKSSMAISSVGEPTNAESKIESENWFEKIIPLSQRLLAAFIVDDETEDCERRDTPFHYGSEDSPCGTISHIDNNELKDNDKMDSEIESEADMKIQKHCSIDSFSCDGSTASNNFRSPVVRSQLCGDETWQEEDGFGRLEVAVMTHHGRNSIEELQTLQANHSDISSLECNYQQMSLDDRILAELHSIGIFPEMVPDLAEGEDEEIGRDISRLKKGLHKQVRKKKGQLYKLEKAIQKAREKEEQELEELAMDKLIEMAYKRHLASRGGNSSNKSGVSKASKQAALAFAKRTMARYKKFRDTGKSCFSDPPYRDVIFSTPLNSTELGNSYGEIHNCQPDSRGSAAGATERHVSVNDKLEKAQSDAFQGAVHHEPLPKSKKREVLLDDVVNFSAARATSSMGNSLLGGAKGKRSERDRDQNKESTRGSVAKAGRPIGSNLKGERKTKTKPKQKTAQLSASGNGLVGRFTEPSNPVRACSDAMTNNSSKVNGETFDSSKDTEDPIDLTNLPLPGMDDLGVGDLGGQGQDLSSWLNFDADGLQDNDLMGLGIPMDDLNMIL
ncbi:hypothetical protein H6P81_003458 [Aristolochia fimbriata]|uniref:Uncharacterized protein n=1 Tax=Aristolochia fimbriata TaxID=158543 RepID=A0AAV7FFM5_ARIFI|nr:hypothetical protein H6P81_003458 [Aristolochia fimbriata]